MSRSLLALALAALSTACAHAPVQREAAPTVRFLSVNDVYVADTLRDGTGGLARLPALRRQLGGGAPVLFVLAGDVLSPSLLSKWFGGRQMVDAFNAIGLDYATFGNHEFELDRDTVVARIRQSRFKWISSNCTLAGGAPIPGVLPWDTTTVSGVRVGLFGLTLAGDYRRWVTCGDPDRAATAAVAALRAAGAEAIVGLTHQSLAADSALLVRQPDVALILGGHEHEWHYVNVEGRLVVKADANARTARAVTLTRDGSRWRERTRLDSVDARLPADAAAERVIHAWQDTLFLRLGPERVVATAAEPIDGRDATSRYRESPLGDLVTDAMRLGTGADAAIINSGTMRFDDILHEGPITNYQLETIFLFADGTHVLTFQITGARLRALLEHSVSDAEYGHAGFLQVSGIAFTYDPKRADGARVTSLTRSDGTAIAPSDTLRLAFNAYPACERGDGYVVSEAAAACASAGTGPRAVDLLMRHLTNDLRGEVRVPRAGRIGRKE